MIRPVCQGRPSGAPRSWARLLATLFCLIALTGCATRLLVPPAPTLMALASLPAPEPTATATATPPPPPAPNRTAVTYSAQEEALDHPALHPGATRPAWPTPPSPGSRAADASLLFAPPMPSAAEVLAWRPPSVPVPHSLHPHDHYWLRRPIPSGRVDYGLDWYPYGGSGWGAWRLHHGMDFPNDPGTPVLAAGDGVVVWVEDDWAPIYAPVEPDEPERTGDEQLLYQGEEPAEVVVTAEAGVTRTLRLLNPYGNTVIIRHDWGWQGEPVFTLYAHLLEVFVRPGDRVSGGDLLGGVGNTGNSTGPHLHFEVRVGANGYGYTRNPALWIAPYEGWGNLAGLISTARGTPIPNALVAVYPLLPGGQMDRQQGRFVATYAGWQVNPDEYWGENVVIPDLPAGSYQVVVRVAGEVLEATVEIRAGVTSFVALQTRAAYVPTRQPTATTTPQATPTP